MAHAVLEVKLGEGGDFNAIRKWAASNIRGGDGLVLESGRIFFVFPEVGERELQHAVNRLAPGIERLGGTLHVHSEGEDEVADSIFRRADAQILPVQTRRKG